MRRLGIALYLANLYSIIYMKKFISFALISGLLGGMLMAMNVRLKFIYRLSMLKLLHVDGFQLEMQAVINTKMIQKGPYMVQNGRIFGR